MENNKNIEKIYENTINQFLQGWPEENIENIKKVFHSYLVRTYSRLNLDQMVDYYSSLEVIKWGKLSLEGKLSVISEDKNLDELVKISLEGLKAADEFRKTGNFYDRKTATQKINLMKELLEKVLDFNKNLATYYYSEGSIDFSYASGITELMSLRTGRSK